MSMECGGLTLLWVLRRKPKAVSGHRTPRTASRAPGGEATVAGESRGRLLEAWVLRALLPLLQEERLTCVWDARAPPLAVKPDLLVLTGAGEPALLLFVTWAGSRTD